MMLLSCDFCGVDFSSIIKIPCGYSIEQEGAQVLFIMPRGEQAYRNICLSCLGNQTGREFST
jgi:hypothetical protein